MVLDLQLDRDSAAADGLPRHNPHARAQGTRFDCFIGTKVQRVTQKAVRCAERLLAIRAR